MTTAKDRAHASTKLPKKTQRELRLEDKVSECERALARLMHYGAPCKEADEYWTKWYGEKPKKE